MNRGELRTAILQSSEFDPQTTTYAAWVNNLINDAYAEIMSEAQWPFCEKTVRMTVRRDKTKARITGGTDVSIANNADNATLKYVTFNDERQVLAVGGHEHEIMEPIFASNPYAEAVYISPVTPIPSTTTSDWTIRHRDYFLPPDCADVIGIEFRNAPREDNQSDGKITAIPKSKDAIANLDLVTVCDVPSCYHPVPDLVLPAPDTALTLSAATASPSVPDMTHYFTYVYEVGDPKDRLWSAPAPVSSITTSGGQQITVTFPLSKRGLRKRLLWGELESDGTYTWYPPGQNLFGDMNYQVASGSTALTLTAEYRYKNKLERYDNMGGTLKRIRFWPRPDGTNKAYPWVTTQHDYEERYFWVRYVRVAPSLRKDTDTPLLPPEHHRLLVDRVLVEVYQRLKDRVSSDNHQLKYRERLRILRGRYGSLQDIRPQKEMRWGRSGGRSRFDSSDFTLYIRKYQ